MPAWVGGRRRGFRWDLRNTPMAPPSWTAGSYRAPPRDSNLDVAMKTSLRAVDLGRTLRAQAGVKVRQPLATLWLALPGSTLAPGLADGDAAELLALLADELNVKDVRVIGDESEL